MGSSDFIQYIPRHVCNLITNLQEWGINLQFVLKKDHLNDHWLVVNKGQLKSIPQVEGKDTWITCENCF